MDFCELLAAFDLQQAGFKPYSCRRGGATRLFQQLGSMERVVTRGRWEQMRTARIYVTEGLAAQANVRLSESQRSRLAIAAHALDVL